MQQINQQIMLLFTLLINDTANHAVIIYLLATNNEHFDLVNFFILLNLLVTNKTSKY